MKEDAISEEDEADIQGQLAKLLLAKGSLDAEEDEDEEDEAGQLGKLLSAMYIHGQIVKLRSAMGRLKVDKDVTSEEDEADSSTMATSNMGSSNIVAEPLRKDNHENWRACVKNYLLSQDLWGVVEEETEPPKAEEDEEGYKAWRRKNSAALHAIQISCSPELLAEIRETSTARDAWMTLDNLDSRKPRAVVRSQRPTTKSGPSHSSKSEKGRLAKLLSAFRRLDADKDVKSKEDEDDKDEAGRLAKLRSAIGRLEADKDVASEKNKAGRLVKLLSIIRRLEEDKDFKSEEDGAGRLTKLLSAIKRLEADKDVKSEEDEDDEDEAVLAKLLSGIGRLEAEVLASREWPSECTALIKAICRGDLSTVKHLLVQHPDLVNANIVRIDHRLALHFAILGGRFEIADEFLRNMSIEDSIKQCRAKRTILHYAAMHNRKSIAEQLIQKNKELLTIPDNLKEIPLLTACRNGHEDMAHYLYSMTPPDLLLSSGNQYHHANKAIAHCINNKIFDVALDLLRRCPRLVTYGISLRILSSKPSAFLSTSGLSFWQLCVYSCLKVKKPDVSIDDTRIYTHEQNQKTTKSFILKGKLPGLWSNVLTFFGIKQIYDLKQNHSYAHELLVLITKRIANLEGPKIVAIGVDDSIFDAARLGMTEFIAQIIKANPDLLWLHDNNGRNIFECAVANRQEKTFSLIYGMDFMKGEFCSYGDKEGNNILQLAGQLPADYSQLSQISGAAMQMQRELQWFKEVQSLVPPAFKSKVNKNGKTAEELFNESHVDMIKEGEKWMKDIAQSSIIVGTLIITIMFAALYTVPGGDDQETGIPLLLTKKAFKVFVMSDAISLSASSTSVLMFVGILTSRYTANDFLKSLPTKLIIALSSLFISIATMMITFSSTAILMLKGQLAIIIPVILLAGIPVILFIWLQFPLLVKMIISTYGPGIFDRKMKNWLK